MSTHHWRLLTGVAAIGLVAAWAPARPVLGAADVNSAFSVWHVTATPNPVAPPPATSNVSFSAVSAAGAVDAWAVGGLQIFPAQAPLAEHWTGTAWRVVATAPITSGAPSQFNGVDDVSPTDAWAVGQTQDAQGDALTLIEHWDGTRWSIVPSPNPVVGFGTSDQLQAIGGVGPTDLWAVGSYSPGTTFIGMLFEHWDGTRWSVVPPPDTAGFKFGTAVSAIAANDVWAVGNVGGGSATLAEHWNGQRWSVVPTPNLMDGRAPQNFLTGVSQAGAHDVWASGYEGNVNQMNFAKPYMLHWDGTAWHLVLLPNAGSEGSYLHGTTALSPRDVWAVGQTQEGDGALLSLTEHFNGSAWSIVHSPTPGDVGPLPDSTLQATAAISGGLVWAVGSQEIPDQCCVRTLAMAIPRGGAAAGSTPDGVAASTTEPALARGGLAWGDNSAGELGDGSTVQRDVPATVTNLSAIRAVAAGGRHSLALLSSGAVMAWGDNTFGQLGDGTTTVNHSSTVPVTVTGLSGVVAVASGGEHSLALLANGTVMAWGDNASGQLGNGTTTSSAVPVPVSGLSGVVAISAGYLHSMAVLRDGTVRAWGSNLHGQLGNGTDSNISTVPMTVTNLSGVAAVAAGGEHSLALLRNGTVMAWGQNIDGELGNGTIIGSDTPVTVTNLGGVVAIAAGSEHSVALLANGTVQAWGSNSFYQLGQNNNFPGGIGSSDVPVAVAGLSGVRAIAAGGLFNLALLTNGTVMDWGDNAIGQLGNGTSTPIIAPTALQGLSGVTAISAGSVYSLATHG
jgi:alpha-tubulin suppressor-like RCC1 family protein